MQAIVCAIALLSARCGDTSYPLPHDVIIHEIMTDPSPPVSLPEYEYIELMNRSSRQVQLQGWKLKGNGGSVTLPDFALEPGALVVVAPRRAASFYHPSIDAGSFFSLHNDEDLLSLESPTGRVIHAVAVNMRLYAGSFKSAGGWSLEMKDPSYPCAGITNWIFSSDPSGGTPGKPNSVASVIEAPPLPVLIRTTTPDSIRVRLHFSAPLDSASAAYPLVYNAGRTILGSTPEPPEFMTVLLRFADSLPPGAIFQVSTSGLKECSGQSIPSDNPVPYGRPMSPSGLVISEILPDPVVGADDFVEIYNNGPVPIAITDLRWTVQADDGSWKPPVPVVRRPYLLFPGEYLALHPAPEALCRQYACLGRLEAAPLPALGAEAGRLGLFTKEGILLDEASWNRARHAPELAVTKGVSFERLDFGASGLEAANWHSAASTAGYATPGYRNSHFMAVASGKEWCSLGPKVFRPGNNGQDDLAWINWNLPAPGFRLDVRIFDAAGRPVRHLAANISVGNTGRISWNGLGDNGLPVPNGPYAVRMAAWDGNGEQLLRKLALVLIRD